MRAQMRYDVPHVWKRACADLIIVIVVVVVPTSKHTVFHASVVCDIAVVWRRGDCKAVVFRLCRDLW